MTDGRHIAQEDLALYAMHGSSSEESAAVRLHVKECAECRAEVEKVAGDLAVVAMSVEQHPLPEGARQRFIEKIAAAPAAQMRGGQENVISIRSEKPARRAGAWFPWAAAAVLALIAIMLGVQVNSLQGKLREDRHELADLMDGNIRAQKVLDVLNAPEAQHVLLTASKAAPVPSARAIYLASRGGLIFQASNMGPLPEHKAYELWVIPANGKAPIPAGLFWPDAAGNASLVMPELPVGVEAKAFGVTIERAEGSATPTLPIILAGATPAS